MSYFNLSHDERKLVETGVSEILHRGETLMDERQTRLYGPWINEYFQNRYNCAVRFIDTARGLFKLYAS